MSGKDTIWEKQKWQIIQNRLGYTDEEMKRFRANQRNEAILSRVPELMNKTIIAEVVDSHGCNSQHKVGDKFYFDSAGNLLTGLSPKRICVYALNAVVPQIFTAQEFLYAAVDPNEIRFKRAGCFDVGVACEGWGRIVMEIRVEERKKV